MHKTNELNGTMYYTFIYFIEIELIFYFKN